MRVKRCRARSPAFIGSVQTTTTARARLMLLAKRSHESLRWRLRRFAETARPLAGGLGGDCGETHRGWLVLAAGRRGIDVEPRVAQHNRARNSTRKGVALAAENGKLLVLRGPPLTLPTLSAPPPLAIIATKQPSHRSSSRYTPMHKRGRPGSRTQPLSSSLASRSSHPLAQSSFTKKVACGWRPASSIVIPTLSSDAANLG